MEKIDKSKPYGCELCKTAFELPVLLKNHMNTHAELLKFKCQFCEASFLSKQYLIFHERTHSRTRPFECKLCQKIFISRNKWIEHKRLHTGETPFQCAFCDESFSTANLLRNHQAQHHTVHRKTYEHHLYQCDECDKRFQLESALLNHKKLHHFEHKGHGSGKTKQTNKYARSRNNNLQRHKRKTNLSNRKQLPKCSICGKTFNSHVTLRKHEECHYQSEIFKCKKCNKQFISQSALSAHRKTHLVQLFECLVCHQKFNSRNNLDSHRVYHHPSDKPYGCQFCSLSFKLPVELKVHLRLHSNERPFRCSLCPLAYQRYNHLAKHVKIKHPEEENNLLELSFDETSSTAESDSSATEIYMIQSEVEVSDESSNSKTSAHKIKEEKAPITFLFRGRLEGQKSVEKNKDSNKEKNVHLHQHLEQKQFIDQVELWDKGISQNSCGPDRKNGSFKNTSSYENAERCDKFQNGTNQTGTGTSTNSSEPVRQQMVDLPKLSNYGDTDNLLSWPSPLQITIFEHFESSSENEFSEGSLLTEEKTLLTGRKQAKTNKNCYPLVAYNEGIETADNKDITLKMQINPDLDNQQRMEEGGIPDVVMNNLSENGSQQFEDILDEILGDTCNENISGSNNRTKLNVISNDNRSLSPITENGNKLKQKSYFVFENGSRLNKEEHVNVESYNGARNIVNDNLASKFESDRLTKEEKDRPSETGNRNNIKQNSQEKFQSEIAKESKSDFLKIPRGTCKSKKGQWIETSDPNIKFKNKDKHVRDGQYIKVDRKISFFVTKTSSVNDSASASGYLDSVDSDIADRTTIEGNGTSIICSDNDSVRSCYNSSLNDASTISDFDDDAEWDSYSADESIVDDSFALDTSTDEALNTSENISTPNISAEESTIESDTEATTDYDNDENPMTDNCSSQDTGDEINFDHQKEHTIDCIKKKTRWLKRNFKFKKSMFGSKHCVSYSVYNKNYSDFTKLVFRRCAAEIEKKYGENRYMTEEKIAGIREMIKKKHFTRPAYTSDDSSVEASETSVKMHDDEIVSFAQQKFKITSPRYKTRYTLKKIHEKNAHHNFNIPVIGTTVVKSNVNVRYNKIASPRYKTRYTELKLTKQNGHLKGHDDKKRKEKETSYCEMNNDRCIGNKTFVNEKPKRIQDDKPTSKKNKKRKSKCIRFEKTRRDGLDASESFVGETIRMPKGKHRKLETEEEIKSQFEVENNKCDNTNTVVNHISMPFNKPKQKKRNGSVNCFERKINKMRENEENKIINAKLKSAKTETDSESDEKRTNKYSGILNNRNKITDNDRKRNSDRHLLATSNDVTLYVDESIGKELSYKDEKSFYTNYTTEQSGDEIVHAHEKPFKHEDDPIKNNTLTWPKLETQFTVKKLTKDESVDGNVSPDIFPIREDKVREKSDNLDVKFKTQQNIQLEYSEKMHRHGSHMEQNQESNDRARIIKDQKDVNVQIGRKRLTLYDKYQAITHWSSLGYFKKNKKDVDKDVPYLILRGYKTSGPDVVVPPFENTRLKCKEREGTNNEPFERSSTIGSNNIQEDNVQHRSGNSFKASKRSIQKQQRQKKKKQKKRKDIRSFSNGFTLSTESARNRKDGKGKKRRERSFIEILNECRSNSFADTTNNSTTLYDTDPKRTGGNNYGWPRSMKESSALLAMPEIQNLPKATKYGISQAQTSVNESSYLQPTCVQKEHSGIKPEVGKKLRRTMEEVVKALMESSLAKTKAQTLQKCKNVSVNWKEICDNQPVVKLKRIDV